MAKQRYINTRIWRDSYFENLDPSEKLLFIYFLTNPDTNICGIYEIPLKIVSVDTGFNIQTIKEVLSRFEKDKKMLYRNGWITIRNFIKHQNLNPKVKRGIEIEIKNAPKDLINWVKNSLSDWENSLSIGYDSLSHSNSNSNSNSNTNTNINTNTNRKDILSLTTFLFNSIMKNTAPTKYKNKKPDLNSWAIDINKLNRIDGIKIDDIKKTIIWCTSHDFWAKNILSGAKLRKNYTQLEIQMKGKKEMTYEERLAENRKIVEGSK